MQVPPEKGASTPNRIEALAFWQPLTQVVGMANENPFSAHIVPEGAGASFAASRGGGFAIVIPLTLRAEHWLLDNLTAEASWQGDSLVVELSHFPALADAIIEAGFTFERDPLPN